MSDLIPLAEGGVEWSEGGVGAVRRGREEGAALLRACVREPGRPGLCQIAASTWRVAAARQPAVALRARTCRLLPVFDPSSTRILPCVQPPLKLRTARRR